MSLDRLYAGTPRRDPGSPEARRFNRAQTALARILVPVNYSRASAFHHDSTYEPLPLPDLSPATGMPNLRGDVHQRGVLQAHLLRGRNRLVWALEQARQVVDAALPSS
jgi:N-acetylated-alpha-linked acidic dipeptidase